MEPQLGLQGQRLDADDEDSDGEAQMQQIVWAVAGLFVAASVVSSVRLIRGHLSHFTQPTVQSKVEKCTSGAAAHAHDACSLANLGLLCTCECGHVQIVGILWMVPIYAIDSWLSLRFKNASLYLDLMRDSYESYVIYLFLALMIAYLSNGRYERVLEVLQPLPDLHHPWPFSKWCAPIPMGPDFLRDCKMATMQFVVIKPLMALLAILLHVNGMYDQGNFSVTKGYLYTSLIVNASITYAFYYLVLFYLALREQLKPYNPVPKFLCIKAVLFLSFWQSVVLAFLSRFEIIHQVGSWTVENVTTGIQNVLICFEMCFVALAHNYAFPYAPYVNGGEQQAGHRKNILSDHLALEDAMRDFNEVMPVVLPTPFKPMASIMKGTKNLARSKDVLAPESVRLLDDQDEHVGDPKMPRAPDTNTRGWKL